MRILSIICLNFQSLNLSFRRETTKSALKSRDGAKFMRRKSNYFYFRFRRHSDEYHKRRLMKTLIILSGVFMR